MIKVSVLYANSEAKKFDMAYYCDTHMPMVRRKLGEACIRVEVKQGLAGGHPDQPIAVVIMSGGTCRLQP